MRLLRRYIIFLLPLAAIAQGPPSPMAFEVASVRPSSPVPRPGGRGNLFTPAGLDFQQVALRTCVLNAWRIKDYQLSAPSWMADLKFDILAKAPAKSSPIQVDEMLQTLLIQRFHMRVHHETRETSGLALVPAKGGLKLIESTGAPLPPPDASLSQRNAQIPNMTMPRPDGGFHLVERRVKIPILAGNLSRLLGTPVFDMTGAAGDYDFVLDLSRDDVRNQTMMLTNGVPWHAPEPAPGEAAAPSGPSIFDSLQKYGLRLESRKVPVDFIVVDSADKVPTEN